MFVVGQKSNMACETHCFLCIPKWLDAARVVTEGKFLGEGAAAQLAAWIVWTYVCWN